MGPAGLTAVFGMGTGGTPPVWSPERRPAGGQARRTRITEGRSRSRRYPRLVQQRRGGSLPGVVRSTGPPDAPGRPRGRGTERGGQALGCWDGSAAAVARRALPAHRPGRLPGAFAARAAGNLVWEGASRLDAVSADPVPTWLPGGAPSGTAGTPAVGPPQSSRTRGDAPQVSSAHGR